MAKNRTKKAEKRARRVSADAGAVVFSGMDDPRLLEYIRHGMDGTVQIDGNRALSNSALNRCVFVLSEVIGMLPLNLMRDDEHKELQKDNPLYDLLKHRPNGWQTPYEFKRLLQGWVLNYGNAYARIIRVGKRVLQLIPMHPSRVEPKQDVNWNMTYQYTREDGGQIVLPASDVLHLRDFSEDGIKGISRVNLAKKALGIAFDAEEAVSRNFKEGMMAGGVIQTDKVLSNEAYGRIKDSLEERHSGSKNAGKVVILENGLKAAPWANTAADAQLLENRGHQIEEVARFFGVPRPLLMMDDTSWGSGINELGNFFLKYGLNHWFTMWEQALGRALLNDRINDGLTFKFNPGALLRGSLKDQAEYFSKALGAGGTQPWMTQHEVRDVCDLPRTDDADADSLKNPLTTMKKKSLSRGAEKNEPDDSATD